MILHVNTETTRWLASTGYYTRPTDPGPEYRYVPHSHNRKPPASRPYRGERIPCSVPGCTKTLRAYQCNPAKLCRYHAMLAFHKRQGHKIKIKEKIK